jgi:hypothetical protein
MLGVHFVSRERRLFEVAVLGGIHERCKRCSYFAER